MLEFGSEVRERKLVLSEVPVQNWLELALTWLEEDGKRTWFCLGKIVEVKLLNR